MNEASPFGFFVSSVGLGGVLGWALAEKDYSLMISFFLFWLGLIIFAITLRREK